MEASRTYRADAIVIRRVDIAEADRIVTLYTRQRGKIATIAKGARKALSKLAAAIEPLTYGRYMLATGRTLDIITQAEIRESFHVIRGRMDLIAAGIYFLELVDSFVEENSPNPDIFETLLSSLYLLEREVDPRIVSRSLEVKILDLSGYAPQLDGCSRCGAGAFLKENEQPKTSYAQNGKGHGELAYSPSLGGLVCEECGLVPDDAIHIRRETAALLKRLGQAEAREIAQMEMTPELDSEAAQVLRWHIRYRLERELKSTEFLRAAVSFQDR